MITNELAQRALAIYRTLEDLHPYQREEVLALLIKFVELDAHRLVNERAAAVYPKGER